MNRFFHLLVIWCGTYWTSASDSASPDLAKSRQCCTAGADWAASNPDCLTMTYASSDNFCILSQKNCCRKKIRERNCLDGEREAVRGARDCSNLRNENAKSCCENCRSVQDLIRNSTLKCTSTVRLFASEYGIEVSENCCVKSGSDCGNRSCEHVCHANGLECDCRPGFSLMPDRRSCTKTLQTAQKCSLGYVESSRTNECVDINECLRENICDSNQDCLNAVGSYRCVCKRGFKLDPLTSACVDVNECLTENICSPSQRCDNSIGSYHCIRVTNCGTGYTLNAENGKCEDDDECTLGIHGCGTEFVCVNLPGTFRCVKKNQKANRKQPTFVGAGDSGGGGGSGSSTTNSSHNPNSYYFEPLNNQTIYFTVSPPSSKATETTGRTATATVTTPTATRSGGLTIADRKCKIGFHFDGTRCLDIDECQSGNHKCNSLQTCINYDGYYSCKCPIGYKLTTDNECEDIDECHLFRGSICSSNARCENTIGSFRCVCHDGFRKSMGEICVDRNECDEDAKVCEQICYNRWGSFSCRCEPGYFLDTDNRTCSDVNECAIGAGNQTVCSYRCHNVPGSFRCLCPAGYRLSSDGRSCKDLNECDSQLVCGKQSVCINLRGGYKCFRIECPANYVRDPDYPNRCVLEPNFCSEHRQNMQCHLRPLTYSYNFFALVSNAPVDGGITGSGTKLFSMKGPQSGSVSCTFKIDLVSQTSRSANVTAGGETQPGPGPSPTFFRMTKYDYNQIMVALTRPLEGPQEVELDVTMNVFHNGIFAKSVVAKLFLFVSEYEF